MKRDFQAADRLMHEAVTRSVFPGAVLLVSRREEILLHRAYGLADVFSGGVMTRETVFDLASLTKPLATALAVMLLVQQGRLSLDQPCQRYWPLFTADGKEDITVRHLLSHRSGLPAWRPYYLGLSGYDPDLRAGLLQRAVIQEPLTALAGASCDYSDLGYLVLQWMVEHMVDQTLDRFVQKNIYQPLAVEPLFFIARNRPKPRRPFAATELCPLRGRLLCGEVHDDNAHMLGGIAGHAGLFGTAAGVWALLQALLSAASGKRAAPFETAAVRQFLSPQNGGRWALGFDTPARTDSSAGRYFADGSVGHLGFTGTSFWMDRVRGIILILLTNRVHPSRYNTSIKAFRPRLHDAVMNALLGGGRRSSGMLPNTGGRRDD